MTNDCSSPPEGSVLIGISRTPLGSVIKAGPTGTADANLFKFIVDYQLSSHERGLKTSTAPSVF